MTGHTHRAQTSISRVWNVFHISSFAFSIHSFPFTCAFIHLKNTTWRKRRERAHASHRKWRSKRFTIFYLFSVYVYVHNIVFASNAFVYFSSFNTRSNIHSTFTLLWLLLYLFYLLDVAPYVTLKKTWIFVIVLVAFVYCYSCWFSLFLFFSSFFDFRILLRRFCVEHENWAIKKPKQTFSSIEFNGVFRTTHALCGMAFRRIFFLGCCCRVRVSKLI